MRQLSLKYSPVIFFGICGWTCGAFGMRYNISESKDKIVVGMKLVQYKSAMLRKVFIATTLGVAGVMTWRRVLRDHPISVWRDIGLCVRVPGTAGTFFGFEAATKAYSFSIFPCLLLQIFHVYHNPEEGNVGTVFRDFMPNVAIGTAKIWWAYFSQSCFIIYPSCILCGFLYFRFNRGNWIKRERQIYRNILRPDGHMKRGIQNGKFYNQFPMHARKNNVGLEAV